MMEIGLNDELINNIGMAMPSDNDVRLYNYKNDINKFYCESGNKPFILNLINNRDSISVQKPVFPESISLICLF